MILKQEDIIINKYAQDRLSFEDLLKWFNDLTIEKQRETLLLTSTYLTQSITKEEKGEREIIDKGMLEIPLKPTMTPIVLLRTKSLKVALNSILELPDPEMQKSFIALVTLFKTADTKRRNTECKNGCGHFWHNLDRQSHF